MASLKTYTLQLWRTHRDFAEKLGLKLGWSQLGFRVIALSNDLILAVLIKTLTDKGVLTDQELNAAYTAARALDLPQLPSEVPAPEGDNSTVPEPDLGS